MAFLLIASSLVCLNVSLGIRDYLIKNEEIKAMPRGILWKHLGFLQILITLYFAMCNAYPCFVCIIHEIMYPWYVIIIPMYNAHPYFPLKNLGKKLCITHRNIQYKSLLRVAICASQVLFKNFKVIFIFVIVKCVT